MKRQRLTTVCQRQRLRLYPTDDESGTNIYDALRHHQCTANWLYRNLLKTLSEWERKINFNFKLELPLMTLGVCKLRRNVGATYLRSPNSFGLKHEILFNSQLLPTTCLDMTIESLAHEMVHAWQLLHGNPSKGKCNYHNKEFIEKAGEIGMLADSKGHNKLDLYGPLRAMLQSQGVKHTPDSQRPVAYSKSTLIKWTCGCQNVWAGAREIHIKCLRCGNVFESEHEIRNTALLKNLGISFE